ncbi:MAG TPA: cell wall hydrolase [Paracoccaceae bacterium]|nr:cell wall hydrolase [Paracoccaceae bacterium]
MRLRQGLTGGLLALALMASGAAFADVTVSQSNSQAVPAGKRFAALMGAERDALAALPPDALTVRPPVARSGPVTEVRYDAAWLASQPVQKGDAEWSCLAKALYFEARGETLKGQFAVAEVILNRVRSPLYPSTICGVVHQAGGGGCQFSYTCDGRADVIGERGAWDVAQRIASVMLNGAPSNLTNGATHFHTTQVRPNWAHRFPRTAAIGMHLFYRAPAPRL